VISDGAERAATRRQGANRCLNVATWSYSDGVTAIDSSTPVQRTPERWAELDLIRALAGVFMVVNHAGVAWLSWPSSTVNHALVFVGSLAPVLFFTVTGMGRGIQASTASSRRSWSATLRKVSILLLADAAMWLEPNTYLGMDFLGFIAISTIVLELVYETRRPILTAATLAVGCLALRFVVASRLGLSDDRTALTLASHVIVGDSSVPGFSYTLSPWLAYPLFGCVVGSLAARHAERIRAARGLWALLLGTGALVGLGLCVVLAQRGMIFFRWGSMSFAYCVFGFSAVLASLATALLVVRTASATALRNMSLPSAASFALVPIHYAFIGIWRPVLRYRLNGDAFPFVVAGCALLVLTLSKWTDRQLAACAKVMQGPGGTLALLVTTLILLLLLPQFESVEQSAPLRWLVQFLACALFVVSSRPRNVQG